MNQNRKQEVHLLVGGIRYKGWKSIRVTQSIESLAGSFALDVSNRWGHDELWPIAEEDECRVEIVDVDAAAAASGVERVLDRKTVLDGYIDKRSMSASKESRTLSYEGRDRAAALVDCAPELNAWKYDKIDVAQFITSIAIPFGISVSMQAGLKLSAIPRAVCSPGETVFEMISRLAAADGVLLVSDGAGGIVITRAGTERASSLVESANILSASVEYDATDRFHRYVLTAQMPGTDEAFGEACRVTGRAIDEGVRRTEREIVIRADRAYTETDARKRLDWEARIRAARAEQVSITVVGWKQPSGELWTPNTISHVKARRLIGVDGDMLISRVEYSLGEGGELTHLRLVRPDAFTPEPKTATVKASGGRWKELDKGGL